MGSSREGGVLIPPGSQTSNQTGGKVYTPVAHYPSSNGRTAPGLPAGMAYTVCEVNDGTTSCDCMGWTRRNPPGGRTCKHTQDYENFLNDGIVIQPSEDEFLKQAAQPVGAKGPDTSQKGGLLTDLFKKLDEDGLK